MPTLCTENDRARIYQYIAKEPEMNLFFYGDLENFGVQGGPIQVWAFPGAQDWDCLLLQFYDSYIVYSPSKDYNAATVAEFLKGRTCDCISGKLELVQKLTPFFPKLELQPTYMCRCNQLRDEAAAPLPQDVQIRLLEEADFPQLLELLSGIQEFEKSNLEPEKAMERQLENYRHGSLTYGVYRGERLLATAATTADNSQNAMVVSVATRPEERGHGYASAAVAALCQASFAKGRKFLCLFYDNPAAGRIYLRLGFEKIGQYAMLH